MEIAVIGSGGWGTALAKLLSENGHAVTLWSFLPEEAAQLQRTRENPLLPGVRLPELAFTSDPACAAGKPVVVMASPSFAARSTAELVGPYLRQDAVLVSVAKGIEAGTSLRLSEIYEQVTGRTVAVLCGPSHAEEVGRGIPTGCVAASRDIRVAEMVQDIFMNDRFRVYASADVVGVELGAALKNVVALCAGICDGMGFGDNTKALLMTRGLTEIARLGVALGGKNESFAGLTGVGDLVVTCTSMHSRNRRAGILIGQGKDPKAAMDEVGAVVEGYYAAKSAHELAEKAGVEMPIAREAYAVLYEGRPPREAMQLLMTRDRRHEFEDAGW
ncbi:MAG: NAD(P)-dependent glycerol-3-phosphate dehydrogenase [Oscillospiraceae bacterium]|nr:NAD(P)-dependent glycerol-3-phosphate dehydrogenase [Oscillospiraceae bacterium]